MRLILHKTVVLFLILVLFLSTIGISFYLHTCECKQSEDISFSKKESQCFMLTTTETVENAEQFIKFSCCKDLFFFYKLHVPFVQTIFSFLNYTFSFSFLISDQKAYLHELCFCKIFPGLYHPPPSVFFGRQLINFLHSIKIPFPVL